MELDAPVSFETAVLSQLSGLSSGQDYIHESVTGIKEQLKTLNGSVKDLYEKHHQGKLDMVALEVELTPGRSAHCTNRENRIAALELKSAVDAAKIHKNAAFLSRWYHWIIILTGTSLATIVSTIILRALNLIK